MKCAGCGRNVSEDQLTLVARLKRNYCPSCLSWVPLQRVFAALLLMVLAVSAVWIGNKVLQREHAAQAAAEREAEKDRSAGRDAAEKTFWEKFYDEAILVYVVVGFCWFAAILFSLGTFQSLLMARALWRARPDVPDL